MKKLTSAEEEVMQLLWAKSGAFVKELLDAFPEPKPAYNTVSTIVRILVDKGFVGVEVHGKSHKYLPLVSKEAYAESSLDNLVEGYFGNSLRQMLSFFVQKKDVSLSDLEELMRELPSSNEDKKGDKK